MSGAVPLLGSQGWCDPPPPPYPEGLRWEPQAGGGSTGGKYGVVSPVGHGDVFGDGCCPPELGTKHEDNIWGRGLRTLFWTRGGVWGQRCCPHCWKCERRRTCVSCRCDPQTASDLGNQLRVGTVPATRNGPIAPLPHILTVPQPHNPTAPYPHGPITPKPHILMVP